MAQFGSDIQGPLHIITCPDVINDAVSDQLEHLAKTTWLSLDVMTHVFDFSHVQELSKKLYRPMVQFKQALRARNCEVVSINVPLTIRDQMVADGMTNVFRPFATMAEAAKKLTANAPKPTLNIDFINPFITAVQLTFETEAKTKVEIGTPIRKRPESTSQVCVAAVLSLDAEIFQGSIVLKFPKDVFLSIYKNMLGKELPEITPESEDAAGELLNIIFGVAKAELNNKRGFKIKKALPTVFVGSELTFPKPSNAKMAIVIPCKTPVGVFELEIHFGANH